jgi:hypothetical protein
MQRQPSEHYRLLIRCWQTEPNISGDYFFTENLSVGAEQAIFYAFDNDDEDGIGGRTVGSLDYHFGTPREEGGLAPYIGANVGGIYGEGVDGGFIYGPELGLTLWGLKAKLAYDIRDDFDEGVISSTLGWGLRF